MTKEALSVGSTAHPLETESQKFVYTRTYSRWRDELGRRENWEETVERLVSFIKEERKNIPTKVLRKIKNYVYNLEVMPSMRLLWAAGDAARADNITMYNCSFVRIRGVEDFSELLYILMCGTGVGFSVVKEDLADLPVVPMITSQCSKTLKVEDHKKGWADSLKILLLSLFNGEDVDMDYTGVRLKGTRLKTMGGRASGPEPLIKLHEFVRHTMQTAQGRRLTPLEAHDLCCQIAEIVVVGGVRRSSLISLSSLEDYEMRGAKVYPFPACRYMANNSAIYDEKPSAIQFLQEWVSLAASGSGERGIYNRYAARQTAPKRRDSSKIYGTNPCAEIALRDKEFCNLSEIVVKSDDDFDDLLDKVETATWMGVIQSTFTNFPYLRPEWKENCEEERLLGVSITGQYDAPGLMTDEKLAILKERSIRVARKASKIMGVNMPASITCVKPSGSVSQLVNSASGMHPRYSQYYIRRYRISASDPLFRMMRDQGAPCSPENAQGKKDWDSAKKIYDKTGLLTEAHKLCTIFDKDKVWSKDLVNTWVISFPMKSPDCAITVKDVSALDQLEWYKKVQKNWCEHNASITVYVKDNEWMDVGKWVYENWDFVVGVSFLPADSGSYKQAPYEEITKEKFEEMCNKFPSIDYSVLSDYEIGDQTEGSKTYACTSGACEL